MAEPKHPGSVTEWSYSEILRLFAEEMEKKTGIQTLVEPQPVELKEPHLRILAPTGFEFNFEDDRYYELGRLYTVRMDALVTLAASGDGPDLFLNKCIEASFKVNKFFYKPFSILLSTGYISINGKRKPGGQFFKNEKEGEKPYLYEESFEASIYFPYAEEESS
ncbi:MAG: hypothetical protein HY096_09685 [Nitrospinae bacterium]|nr:hypothetical protein [Nitrospinota bacterium]